VSENLITLDNICLAYGLDVLLDKAKFQIASGERVCLIGRNGAGKSSLLKIIQGVQSPDSGSVWRKPQLRMARLMQELPRDCSLTVYEFVALGIAEAGQLLSAYHTLINKIEHGHTEADLLELERLQHAIDAKNAWQFDQTMKTILGRLELNPDRLLSELSGGWQRRAALAQALVSSPELLLLDEPTNHLDIEAIQWLEDQLITLGIGLIFVTHDRSLLQRLATRIIELDRGKLTSWPGDYANFLRRKEEMLAAEENQNSEFDKKLALEERWIRQGIKARRTRNEGRVRALEALRDERSKRREVQGKVNFNVNEAQKSGALVVEAKNISHSFNQRTIIDDFTVRIMRGDRIGLIGPNGAGKSTLLNILLGKLQPESGQLTQGTRLQIAYFDQLREALDLEKTVIENVAEGNDTIEINGRSQHIISYLNDFLFTPQRAMTPVKALSGGECNRLLLARLFSRPANLLILDEPTNDLDIETLELLEELLSHYQGTLLIVSHDRAFLDNVVTSTIVFEEKGKLTEYVGGYQDWLRQRQQTPIVTSNTKIEKAEKVTEKQSNKLSYKETQELAQLPKLIEKLEAEQVKLQALISQSEFYQGDSKNIATTLEHFNKVESDLMATYERWEELMAKNK
jgi:ATP-binding cassette subfamily F protein uup